MDVTITIDEDKNAAFWEDGASNDPLCPAPDLGGYMRLTYTVAPGRSRMVQTVQAEAGETTSPERVDQP